MSVAAVRRKIVRLGVTALLCLTVYGIPAQAQNYNNRNNWYNMHRQWSSRCYSQRQQGHWARNQRDESWCSGNQRFRNTRPDTQWRRSNPHDNGRENDNAGDHR